MGYFHEGHLALMRYAKQHSDHVVVSLFVNPTQFGPSEDLDSYPRDLERDSALAKSVGVDAIFCPTADDMYGDGFQTTVHLGELSQGLCGTDRPGHFDGVAVIVTKLFNLIKPHLAVFGKKDFQQLALIRQLVRDLNMNVEIAGHAIVREADGLAMSSRNKYLNEDERGVATCLFTAIQWAKSRVKKSKSQLLTKEIEERVRQHITEHRGCSVEYVSVVNKITLRRDEYVDAESVLAVAMKVNNHVRLIDNARLQE
jgi:pantoate--beta-alanine ligase